METQARKDLVEKIKKMQTVYDSAATPETMKAMIKTGIEGANKALEALDAAEKELADAEEEKKKADKEATIARAQAAMKTKAAKTPAAKEKIKAALSPAIEKAKKAMGETKKAKEKIIPAKKAAEKATKSLKTIIAAKPELKKLYAGETEKQLVRDAGRRAMNPGKRTSASGHTYYEKRANRVDLTHKKYPLLEKGGQIPVYEIGDFKVFKRTFEAKKHNVGSDERKKLNENNITSEYMPSYKYAIHGPNFSSSKPGKQEAIDFAEKLSKNFEKGGKVGKEAITYLNISNENPLSSQLQKLTGSIWNQLDFESVDPKQALSTMNPFKHIKTGKVFAVNPPKLAEGGKIKGTKKLVFFDFDHEDDENDFEGTDTLIGKDFTVTNIKWTKGKDDKTSDSYSGYYNSKKSKTNEQIKDDVENKLSEVGSVNYVVTEDEEFKAGGTTGGTMAELKRKLQLGQAIKMVNFFGQTDPNDTNDRAKGRLQKIRYVVKVQTNGVYFSPIKTDKTGSYWEFPPASLIEVTEKGFKVYGPGARELNAEEKKIMANEPKDAEQDRIDMMSDGSTMYYRRKHYYEYEHPQYAYLFNPGWQNKLRFDSNQEKVYDKDVKGPVELEYEFVNEAEFKAGGPVAETMWLSVDESEPFTYEDFYAANNEDPDVDPLTEDQLDAIKALAIGESWSTGGAGDVEIKRVEPPMEMGGELTYKDGTPVHYAVHCSDGRCHIVHRSNGRVLPTNTVFRWTYGNHNRFTSPEAAESALKKMLINLHEENPQHNPEPAFYKPQRKKVFGLFEDGGGITEDIWLEVEWDKTPMHIEEFINEYEREDFGPKDFEFIKKLKIGETYSNDVGVSIMRVEPPNDDTIRSRANGEYVIVFKGEKAQDFYDELIDFMPDHEITMINDETCQAILDPSDMESVMQIAEKHDVETPYMELGGIIKTDKTTGTFAKALLKKRGSRIHDILYVVGNTTKDEETGTFSLTEQGYEKLRMVLDAYISTDLNQGANIAHQAVEKMSREDYNKLCRALFAEGKKMNYSYLYERGGRLKKITEEKIEEAINEDYFNEAIIIIQDAIGQDDGGVASIHFSGYDRDEEGNIKEWDDKSNRRKIITDYLETEENYASLRADRVHRNASISYHAEVRNWIKKNAPAAYQNVSLDEIPLSVFNDKQMVEYNILIDRFLGNKNYEKGGVFENAESITKQQFLDKVKAALRETNKWHFLIYIVDGKSVYLKLFPGVKEVDVQRFNIGNIAASMPRNYVGKKETYSMVEAAVNNNFESGGPVKGPAISFNKSWSKEGTVYDQRVKIDRDTFNKLKDAVASEIALKYPRKDEYVSTSGYEMYLKPLICEKENVCYLNNTQTRFINLFLKLKLKDRNTRLYIVNKYEDGGELNNDVDITEDLKNFDLDSLDPLEEMMYNDLIKNSPKEQVLQILINNVEGDYSQLSEKLAELAEKQNAEDSYAKGGQVNDDWVKDGDTYTSKSHNYSVRETSDGLFQVLDNEGFDPIGEGFFTLSQAKKVADQIAKENSEFKAGGEIKTEEDFYNAAVAYLKSAYLLEPNDLFPQNVHDDMAGSLKSGETPQDYVDALANKYDLDKVSSGYGYEKGGNVTEPSGKEMKKRILAWTKQFPLDATNWGQATNELPDLHHSIAEAYNERGPKVKYKFDFAKASKTPAECNKRHRTGVEKLLASLDDDGISTIYYMYENWFDPSCEKHENGGELKYKDGRPVQQLFSVSGSAGSWHINNVGINGEREMNADSVKYWTGNERNDFKTEKAATDALKIMLRKMHKENPGYNPAFANGGRVSGEHWFKKAVEDQPPYDLQGWKKDQSAEVRRKHAMDSRPSDMNQHQKLASAGRALQALANVTKDKETKKLAREDAAYFFAAARKQGTKKATNPAIEKAKMAMGKAKKNISTTLFDAIKAEKIKQHNKRVQRYAHYLVVNKKDASYKEKGGPIEGNFVKGIFTIDDEHMYKGYATPGEEWNGWAVPYFEKDEALQILDDTEKPYKWEMKDGVNTLFANLDPEDPDSDYDEVGPIKINVGGKEIETYTPGAYSWVWDTVTIPKGEKLFSWKDKTGRGYNNKRMPLAQILDIENDRNWDDRDLWEWAIYCEEGDEWENATSKFECTKDKTERY